MELRTFNVEELALDPARVLELCLCDVENPLRGVFCVDASMRDGTDPDDRKTDNGSGGILEDDGLAFVCAKWRVSVVNFVLLDFA